MVLISNGDSSQSKGSEAVIEAIHQALNKYDLASEVYVTNIPDSGSPKAQPLVIIYPEAVAYGPIHAEDVDFLVSEHLYKGRVAESLRVNDPFEIKRIAWLVQRTGTMPAENRVVLEYVGVIDPTSINDFLTHDGGQAFPIVIEMKPQEVIDIIKKSGLRGRGGAGFPVGVKWQAVRDAPGDKKYIVCNADESEPGTFKDRVILEGNPFSMIEAMLIAGYACGADEGYIYIRGEYHDALEKITNAIKAAKEFGVLGQNILKTGFSFDIHVHSGAGAYICGEETALLASIEGKRGEPRSKPPYPTTNGLWGKPTLINNVETLGNIPPIIHNGPEWFRSIGTTSSPGTKVYTILGNVNRTGLMEVPMGITLREVIGIYGKGMKGGAFKFAQTGGSSGSIIPAILQDTPMDFDSYRNVGVALGSGALLICDDSNCIVDCVRVLMKFFKVESCGKCVPCRIGTEQTLQIMTDISEGRGTMEQLEQLDLLRKGMEQLSNCGLGQTAGTPIKNMLEHFRAEVEAHIKLGVCPAGVCAMEG
jgi:NADP-reducing hydrogenase subunit HndC